ncbi:sulfite exporter TauE/SafE family protein [Bernardetia sp.]|uniref:sulfite exporter TauE/SafE family protein n=1 Tax=Bernardetia sp. TaxID=1937974 RepID=UPI0025BFFBAA|nr:sulfite exporter TauE/SafE family protein [Bernardetia sp.]
MFFPALFLGLTGSLHCVGMCAPLTFAFMQGQKFVQKLFFYQLGRILMYSILGMGVGYVGQALFFSNWQSYAAFLLGGTLILAGLFSFNLDRITDKISVLKWLSQKVSVLIGQFLFDEKPYRLFFAGLLNGLLPCGLVYFALLGAVAAGTTLEGGIFMIGFGIGTLPLLLASLFFSKNLSRKINTKHFIFQKLKIIYPYAFIVMGIWFFGMGIFAWQNAPINCH